MDLQALLQIAIALGVRELAGWLLTRRKTAADAAKSEAEAESIRFETESHIHSSLFTQMHAEMERMRKNFAEDIAALRQRVDDCEVDRAELRAEIELLKETRQ